MSWRRRLFNRVRMFVDRLYLTAVLWGPWNLARFAIPFALGVFFTLKLLRVICPPHWLSTVGIAILLAHAAYSAYLGRKFNARYRRDNSEAPPPQ